MNDDTTDRNTAECTILTLGDGDFTFSLDLAAFLAARKEAAADPIRVHRLIATGIDSLEDLTKKYCDTPFILKRLQRLGQENEGLIKVEIRHGINAVAPEKSEKACDTTSNLSADHVIFNHPHLGTEDAELHARFLCHLFYAAQTKWMKSGGLFHLTFAAGQYERWQCERAAHRNGMTLIHRELFQAPALLNPYYEPRRHQTGKSFKARTGPSETFTFCREHEKLVKRLYPTRPIWFSDECMKNRDHYGDNSFSCPYCEKVFREKRAVANHLKSKHVDDAAGNNKRKRDETERATASSLTCPHCARDAVQKNSMPPAPPRIFASPQALYEHIRAKHTAIHPDIPPDWSRSSVHPNQEVVVTSNASSPLESPCMNFIPLHHDARSCEICGQTFLTEEDERRHSQSFIPPPLDEQKSLRYECTFCRRAFGDNRARLQHENMCRTKSGRKSERST